MNLWWWINTKSREKRFEHYWYSIYVCIMSSILCSDGIVYFKSIEWHSFRCFHWRHMENIFDTNLTSKLSVIICISFLTTFLKVLHEIKKAFLSIYLRLTNGASISNTSYAMNNEFFSLWKHWQYFQYEYNCNLHVVQHSNKPFFLSIDESFQWLFLVFVFLYSINSYGFVSKL